MKTLLFILILVPFLVIGCAQYQPRPPTVEVARTLVVEPVGEGSYAVGRCSGISGESQ